MEKEQEMSIFYFFSLLFTSNAAPYLCALAQSML